MEWEEGSVNAATWMKIPREEAERHPLFGIRGWFLAFLVLHAIGLAATLLVEGGAVLGILGGLGTFFSVSPVFGVLMLLLALLLPMQAYMLFLGFAGEWGFRRWATWTLILMMFVRLGLVVTLSALTQAVNEGLLLKTFLNLAFMGVLLAYVTTSRRVRVTCEWTVRADDPCLETMRLRQTAEPAVAV